MASDGLRASRGRRGLAQFPGWTPQPRGNAVKGMQLNTSRESTLRFWVEAEDGSSYQLNLTEFVEGGKRENVDPRARPNWPGDFRGRPGFALGLAEVFQALWPVLWPWRYWRACLLPRTRLKSITHVVS